jgi:hypothetical protein
LVESDAAGRVSIGIEALDAVLLEADAELPRRGAARATLRMVTDRFTNLRVLTASLAGRDPASVTFAVRRPGAKTWAPLGADDGSPYRVFVDPRRFPRGRDVSFVAAVRSSDGAVSRSPVVTTEVRR